MSETWAKEIEQEERSNAKEARLSNAIVKQKDSILGQLNYAIVANDVDGIESAWKQFAFVEDMWYVVDYGYKAKEIGNRFKEAIESLLDSEREYLSSLRKNDKTRYSTEQGIEKLKKLLKNF